MTSVFAADTAAIFLGPLAVAAIYTPAGGDPVDIRCMLRDPDGTVDFGSARLASSTALFLIPLEAIAAPENGDMITVEGQGYRVQGAPLRNSRRLWWQIEAVEL